MVKTRARKAPTTKSPSLSQPDHPPPTQVAAFEPSEVNPPQVFILPKNADADAAAAPAAHILTLPHPATRTPSRYLAHPRHGFYEFTRVAPPKRACRSWLLAPAPSSHPADEEGASPPLGEKEGEDDQGHVLQHPDLFIATPVDPLFLLLPVLCPRDAATTGGEQDWGTLHDRLFMSPADDGGESYTHLQHHLKADGGETLERILESRMRAVCKVIDMGEGEDPTFSLHLPGLAAELMTKARAVVERGLPASLEEHFVQKALEVPELSVKREESGVSLADGDATPGAPEQSQESGAEVSTAETSQSTDASATTAATEVTVTSEPATTSNADDLPTIRHLLRLRTALTYLLNTYIPPTLRRTLQPLLNSPETNTAIDFHPLDTHLTHLTQLKADVHALRSISDNISRKRGTLDDDEAVEKAQAKKVKREEEEARKKETSVGVKKLMKADTSGMRKMTSFFTKAGAGAKK